MRRIYLLFFVLALSSQGYQVAAQVNKYYDLNKYIENPLMYNENQEAAHVPLCPFANENNAISGNYESSPYYLSLNGSWNFSWYTTPYDAPEDFYNTSYQVESWDLIQVPGTWQMQNFGYKIYRNIPLEFGPYNPPKVPDHLNPTGLYVKEFYIPESWSGKNKFIHFEGVKSAYWVWINGKYIGFDKGSMTSGEWDITQYIKEGANKVAVKVVRWSDGTYLEDQDMWRFSGIYRDVYIYAAPMVHIRDLFVRTDLDNNYLNANLKVVAEVINYNEVQHDNHMMDVKLYDPDKNLVLSKDIRMGTLLANDEKNIEMSYKIQNPLKWSAEKPNLYKLLLIVKNPDGAVEEIIEEDVGFRHIEIKDAQLLVNGIAVKFKGVNRHEHDPDLGRTMTRELIEKDFKLMKQLNVNAIRTSHYPNDPLFYDLADQYGFYLCDEVNAECHEGENYLAAQSGWEMAFMDRTERFFQRDKNHPSVILWSTGNECGYAPIHHTMAEYLRKNDPTRFIYHQGNIPNGDAPYADVNGIRYPTQEKLRMVGRNSNRPVIMGEYSHAMGNALGGFDEYWEVIYSEKSLQGGFIWDWVNQGLKFDIVTTPDASDYKHQSLIMGRLEEVPGIQGKGLAFSGLDDFVEVYDHPVFNQVGEKLTLETWINPRGFVDVNPLLGKGKSYEITQRHPDSLSFIISIKGIEYSLGGLVPRDWNYNWHHVVSSYDGDEMKLYIDGENIGVRKANGRIDRSPHPVCIGKNHERNHENKGWFISNSQFDQVRIYPDLIDIKETSLFKNDQSLITKSILWLDFEEFNNEGTFLSYGATPQGSGTMDGVVSSYREPQPEAFQMKQSHAPVYIKAVGSDAKKLLVTNRFHFTDLSEVDINWELIENDRTIGSGTLKMNTSPQQSETILTPYKTPRYKDGAAYLLRIIVSLKKKNLWASKGYELCFYEFEVKNLNERKDIIVQEETSGFSIQEADDILTIIANNTSYQLNLESGELEFIKNGDVNLVNKALEFNVWRRPIMNEWSEWGINEAAFWYKYGLDSLIHQVKLTNYSKSGIDAQVEFEIESRSFSHPEIVFIQEMKYNFLSSGDLILSHLIKPDVEPPSLYTKDWFPLSYLPKIGLQFELASNVESLEWYGKGPFETYPDRKTGAKTGVYTVDLDNIKIPYIIPQEFDNRSDVRWIGINSGDGAGLLITSDQLFNVSINPYLNLEYAWYPFQLRKTENPILNIDHAVTGVGGTPVRVRPIYRTYPREYSYKLLIRPYSRNADLFELSNVMY